MPRIYCRQTKNNQVRYYSDIHINGIRIRKHLAGNPKSAHIAHVAHNPQELVGSINDPQADWVYVRYLPGRKDVERIHARGKRVFIAGKTVSGEELANWQTAADIGIDAILTDHALKLQSLLRK